MVWATDIPSHVRLHQNLDTTQGLCDEGEADERLVEWERKASNYVNGGDQQIMTPLPERSMVLPTGKTLRSTIGSPRVRASSQNESRRKGPLGRGVAP